MKSFNLLLLAAVLLCGCDENQHHTRHHRHRKAPKHEIVQTLRERLDNDSWLYWFIVYDSHTRNYYYASSPYERPTFSTINWSTSSARPAVLDKTNIEPLDNEEVETSELGEAAEEITSDYGVPDDNSLDSMEGVPDSADASDSSSDSGGFDSGSSDSGSSDSSGGGDSGGE